MIYILYMQIKKEITIVVKVLNIWQKTVGIEEGLNMGMNGTI